eukprot:TRINITY_DN63595_c0_g1_i1.p1 TRINITY_DN63595_c0_g1~~TRINITY_DN63595_c0_g1_i1.p1  ORF type:complete len:105 (-),score=13.53 TRINITY_DN63595_c0_g1_i1:31-345(-)
MVIPVRSPMDSRHQHMRICLSQSSTCWVPVLASCQASSAHGAWIVERGTQMWERLIDASLQLRLSHGGCEISEDSGCVATDEFFHASARECFHRAFLPCRSLQV